LAGFSPVAVLPEHRGRGWGRAVTAGQYADLHARGEVIAGLFPASVALYRSVGFELAGSYVKRRVPAAHLAALKPRAPIVWPSVRRGHGGDVAAVRRCYERIASRTDGRLVRDDAWWEELVPAEPGDEVMFVVDAPQRPGELDGYAIYRNGKARGPYDYSVVVNEVIADGPGTLGALWRVVGSSGSQAPEVEMIGPAEDPLFLLLGAADPEAVMSEIRWMLRLVDVSAAVAARGWSPVVRGRVDLSVVDDHAPWNAGRWTLELDGGEGQMKRGGSGGIEVTIAGLSSWWAGYASARTLAATGHLRSDDAGALAAMHGMGPSDAPTLIDFY